jgi:hypothetical protein
MIWTHDPQHIELPSTIKLHMHLFVGVGHWFVLLIFRNLVIGRGRSKSRRWANEYGEESDEDHPTSYLDAIRRQVRPVSASL